MLEFNTRTSKLYIDLRVGHAAGEAGEGHVTRGKEEELTTSSGFFLQFLIHMGCSYSLQAADRERWRDQQMVTFYLFLKQYTAHRGRHNI